MLPADLEALTPACSGRARPSVATASWKTGLRVARERALEHEQQVSRSSSTGVWSAEGAPGIACWTRSCKRQDAE